MENISDFDNQLLTEIFNGLSTLIERGNPGEFDNDFDAKLNSIEKLVDMGYIHSDLDINEQMRGDRNITVVSDIFITDSGKQYLAKLPVLK